MDTGYRVVLSLSTCDITVLLNSIPLTCLPDDALVLADSKYTWSFTSAHTQQQHTLEEKGNILNLRNIKTTQEGQYKISCNDDLPPPFQEWQVVREVAGNVVMLLCKVAKFFSSRETEKHPVFWKRETEKGDMLLMPNKDTDDQEENNKIPQRVFWDISSKGNDIILTFRKKIKKFFNLKQTNIYESPPPPRCFGHTDPWEACGDQDRRSGKANLQDSLKEFFTSVYPLLFFSLFASPSFQGARGETRTQLEDALRLPSEFFCVAQKTNKKITKLIDSVDPATSFVLLNAVYFNGKWKTVFEFSNKQENFMKFSGEHLDCICTNTNTYIAELFLQVGKFCLTGKNSLYILIPRTTSEESFVFMENNINRESIESMVSEINTIPAQTAEVRLPKIKLIVDTPLEGLLRNLGLSDLFLKPNLCRIFPGDSESFISDICHSAFLSLTEIINP
uniref:Serpin peptidase inhibitor, clade G (C1 inhibitor), member 1 n=1 Tax=Cyprinus carpio TaxID=7962 RepID=A0A8C2EY34_CYPCA